MDIDHTEHFTILNIFLPYGELNTKHRVIMKNIILAISKHVPEGETFNHRLK